VAARSATLGRDQSHVRDVLTARHSWCDPDPRHADGIYVLVPALVAVLVGGVVNAWLILVKLTD